jgi:hypothetical protein
MTLSEDSKTLDIHRSKQLTWLRSEAGTCHRARRRAWIQGVGRIGHKATINAASYCSACVSRHCSNHRSASSASERRTDKAPLPRCASTARRHVAGSRDEHGARTFGCFSTAGGGRIAARVHAPRCPASKPLLAAWSANQSDNCTVIPDRRLLPSLRRHWRCLS